MYRLPPVMGSHRVVQLADEADPSEDEREEPLGGVPPQARAHMASRAKRRELGRIRGLQMKAD